VLCISPFKFKRVFGSEIINIENAEVNLIKNQPEDRFVEIAQLKILNKVTGKSFNVEKSMGEAIDVEDLKIEFVKCWNSYPEETPENKLLLRVYDNPKAQYQPEERSLIFYGWIFSSSPSLNGIEHPFYDITLDNCKKQRI
jgi:hypothetical protein